MTRIGNLELAAPFYQAGLAGYSDAAMRLIAREHGCPYCVSEALLDILLINGGKGRQHAELCEADHPIAGQIMGSEPETMARAARILLEMGYDVIDVNLACPVKKIRRKARGGHLLSDVDQAVAILDGVRQAVGDDAPCTVKLRRASDDSAEATARFDRILEAAIKLGYAGTTVHGRTVKQKYHGPSNWEALRGIVARFGLGQGGRREGAGENGKGTGVGAAGGAGFRIFGSGDIWEAGDIFRMMAATGVDGVSVARGCIGNPWLFRQARALMAGDEEEGRRPPTIGEQREVLLKHFELSAGLHGEMKAGMMMRKFGIRFSQHHPSGEAVRLAFIAVKDLAEWRGVLDAFYGDDGPGVVAKLPAEAGERSGLDRCDVEGAA